MTGLSEFEKEKQQVFRIAGIQVVAALITTAIAYFYSHSWMVALANIWGVMTSTLNVVALARGLSEIENKPDFKPHNVLRSLYRNSMYRFVLIIVLLSLAMGVLKLPAAVVLCGFVVGQAVPIMARILMIKR